MALTPLLIMAGEGILINDAFQLVPLRTAEYLAQTIVADYAATLAVIDAATGGGPSGINGTTRDAFREALDASAPYISNRPPAGTGTESVSYTTILDQHIDNLYDITDPERDMKFAQYALVAMGAKETANKWINSAVNGANLVPQTYTSQDALMSGNVSAINTNIQAWGQELANTGSLYDFENLCHFGTPQSIVEMLIRVDMLTSIATELEDQGIDVFDLQKALADDPSRVLKALTQKRCYDAFTVVIGDKLSRILSVLSCTVTGIATLADLLDLQKVFPTTYTTLTAPFDGVLQFIYTGTSISTYTDALVTNATSTMPEDQAKANFALAISLQQVTGINQTTSESLAEIAQTIEGNSGLPITNGLTVPLPASSVATIKNLFPDGSGPDDTFYLTDFIGAPAGEPYNTNYGILIDNLTAVQSAGGFDDLALVLQIFRDIVGLVDTARVEFDDNLGSGPWTIEVLPGNPGAGVISSDGSAYDRDEAILNYLPTMDTVVADFIAAYPTEHSIMWQAHYENSIGVVGAIKTLWENNLRFETTYVTNYQSSDHVDIDQDGFDADKITALAFAENLHQYGRKTNKYDIAVILEAMARRDTQGGNAIIASMREGRNLEKLSSASIQTDNLISDQSTTIEPGDIS